MHYYCKHTALSWYHVLSLFSICAFFSFSCLNYLCAGFTCMCMPWTPATLKCNGARFRQKSHSYSVDRTPIFFICSVFWYFNFQEFRRSGISCSDWGRRRNPETKVLDFVERWIKFALPQINILTFLWFDSKIYIANLSVAGETWEKLPGDDTSFDK